MRPIHGVLLTGLLASSAGGAAAQDHAAHHASQSARPTEAGHAAFAAIKEIVAILEADPATDWSRVDLEALRQHLITMDRVMMESGVRVTEVAGGVQLDVTGAADVAKAIREIVSAHAPVLDRSPAFTSRAEPLRHGMRLVVTAENPADARTVARIRGLGFAGLLATDDHHTVHHLAIARGEAGAAHHH